MLFNSLEFLVFFPAVVAVYFVIPRRARSLWLLVASYYFYMSWNPRYALLIALSTAVTYLCGLAVDRFRAGGRRRAMKLAVAASLVINLGILALFKYANFALTNLAALAGRLGLGFAPRRLDLLLPVGISFYTFQALGYTIDVYRGDIPAERNPLRYALFVSFFPQLVAGPIERSKNLLSQVDRVEEFDLWQGERVRDGLLLMGWGLFQKLVIADRCSLLVDTVINDYTRYGAVEIAIAAILFAFQIYCDFGGYTCIARGAAKVMGFSLMDNFRQPYLARSIRDFWRRWHISLTTWFTDYLYIPLGGNRRGEVRKLLNIFIVFAVSGLWHGASWNFVAWGLIHAVYRVVGELRQRLRKARPDGGREAGALRRLGQTLLTFALVDFAWIFFVSSSLGHALGVLRQMTVALHLKSVFDLGLDRNNWFVLAVAIGMLLAADLLHERGKSAARLITDRRLPLRLVIYACMAWAVILFGIYGEAYDTSAFIYFQF